MRSYRSHRVAEQVRRSTVRTQALFGALLKRDGLQITRVLTTSAPRRQRGRMFITTFTCSTAVVATTGCEPEGATLYYVITQRCAPRCATQHDLSAHFSPIFCRFLSVHLQLVPTSGMVNNAWSKMHLAVFASSVGTDEREPICGHTYQYQRDLFVCLT